MKEKTRTLIACFIPIIGPALVFMLTYRELYFENKRKAGRGISMLFAFLYSISWFVSVFIAVAFNIEDEGFFIAIILGSSCLLSPWSAWWYRIKAEKIINSYLIHDYIDNQVGAKKIKEEDKNKFI